MSGSTELPTIRVVLADDHPVFRTGLRALLESTSEVEVIAEAGTGDEAIEVAREQRPDVVVMDLHMPGDTNGVAATRVLADVDPDIRVLLLTMFEDEESVFAAMRAGASGYVLKDAEPEDVVAAILAVGRGGVVFGPSVAGRVRQFFSAQKAPTSPFPQLTAREVQTLDLVAAGLDNQAIARRLGVSGKTVRNSVSNILAKLHVADRPQAIVRARDAGMGRATGPS